MGYVILSCLRGYTPIAIGKQAFTLP